LANVSTFKDATLFTIYYFAEVMLFCSVTLIILNGFNLLIVFAVLNSEQCNALLLLIAVSDIIGSTTL
jgi:formate hydrogenlyase subunit 3/multisubunit Na+/H+ antiporter MnhD subunit